MAVSRTHGATSSRDDKTEQILTTHLIGGEDSFTFTELFPVSEIERNQDSQSRLGMTDKRYVNEMVVMMNAGVPFAPVVLWETPDNGCIMVDGNHRIAAYIKRGQTTIPAYLVKLPGGMNESVYLSAVFNGTNGVRLSSDELRRAVIAAGRLDPEPSNAQLAKDYGVSAAQVGRIRTELATRERLDTLAVGGVTDLTQGHLLPLARISLNDPLKQAAALVLDAKMSPVDTKALVRDLTEAGSESAQIDRIIHERHQRSSDIEAVAAGRKSTGSPTVDLRRMIGHFEKLLDTFPNVQQWVSTDPAVVQVWGPRVTRVAEFMDELQAAYGQAAGADDDHATGSAA